MAHTKIPAMHILHRRAGLRLSAALALCASAAGAGAQTLRSAGSEVGFTIRQMGVPVSGQFRRFEAQIALDPKRPEAGRVAFTIHTGSAGFGSPEVDAEVPKPAWLSAARFPTAQFQSSAVRALGGGRFEVSGTLSLKGVQQAVVVPVALQQSGGITTATGGFAIKRLAFRVGEGEWSDTSMVADEVQVRFKLLLDGMGPL